MKKQYVHYAPKYDQLVIYDDVYLLGYAKDTYEVFQLIYLSEL